MYKSYVRQWLNAELGAKRHFAKRMKAADYDEDVLQAVTFSFALPDCALLDQLIMDANDRAAAILRKMERRRETAACRRRKASRQ